MATLNEVMKDTADAIREKTGKSELIKPIDFAEEIKGITAGGGESGGSNWKYFATSDIEVFFDTLTFASLIKVEHAGVVNLAPVEYGIYLIDKGGRLIAMAYDMEQAIYITSPEGETLTTMGGGIEFILKNKGVGMDYLGVEITKEEFYHIDKSGAYIQHIDGTLYTGGQWTAKGFSNDEANGVAVINEYQGVSLVVAKDKLDSMPWSSMPDTLIDGIFTTTDNNKVEKVYCGVEDTAIIAAADPDSAAAACMNYTFPNGQKGYLMSVGEGGLIYAYDWDIRPLMQLLGETWEEDYAWSCVQRDASNAYCVRLAGLNDEYANAKSSKYIVCPVCTLENYTFME